VGLGDAYNFFDGRLALGHAAPAVLAQRLHTVADRALLQLAAVALLHDQFFQRLGHDTDFVDRQPALISRLPATIAAVAAAELRSHLRRDADLRQIFARIIVHPHAMRTGRAH